MAVAMLLLGCDTAQTASPATNVPPTSADATLANCDKVPCTGVLGGARYEIKLPAEWDGTLLLWSHGYRAAHPILLSRTVETHPESAPSAEVARPLLSRGYALAGSAYARNGWAVTDRVLAGEQLHEAGVKLTFDLALDVTYAVKTLIYPRLKLVRFSSAEDARANFDAAYKAITAASEDQRDGVPKLLLIAALVDAAAKSAAEDGHAAGSRLRGIVLSW